MDEIPDITREQAALIVANTPDDELVDLYVAAWRFWRVVVRTDEHAEWLSPAAAIGNALDIEYEAPLLTRRWGVRMSERRISAEQVGLALLHLWDMFSEDETPKAWIEELIAAEYVDAAEALEAANANQ